MNTTPSLLRIHPSDNVAVAIEDIAPGTPVRVDGVAVTAA